MDHDLGRYLEAIHNELQQLRAELTDFLAEALEEEAREEAELAEKGLQISRKEPEEGDL